jgi:pimeloyl-ACP methyl ester carboxylesterase
MKKWIRRIAIGIIVLIISIVVMVNVGMATLTMSDEETEAYFKEREFDGVIEHISINNKSVRIISDRPQDTDSILLVFVHGAPGSWDAFKTYVTDRDFYKRTRVVAYDRVGYGGSEKTAMPSIEDQSEILNEIIKRFGLNKNVIVGHSYGAPIAGLAAIDNREHVNVVIMIAPLIDPQSEPLFWYSYFSYWKLTSWLLPSDLVVAGSEKFAHANELKKIEDKWKNVKSQFIHVHGLEDGLAPGKENLTFSNRHIPKQYLQTIVYDEKGHLIIWTDYELMKHIIQETLENLQ